MAVQLGIIDYIRIVYVIEIEENGLGFGFGNRPRSRTITEMRLTTFPPKLAGFSA